MVCPVIDVISDESFEYITASDMTWGGFNWKLNFRWYTRLLSPPPPGSSALLHLLLSRFPQPAPRPCLTACSSTLSHSLLLNFFNYMFQFISDMPVILSPGLVSLLPSPRYRVPQREMDRRGGDRSEPLHTPAMAGGLFAIDRDYFYEVDTH